MEIISRQDAIRSGLSVYYTGKRCLKGHLSERSIKSGCIECARARARQWNKDNPDRVKLRQNKWRENNRERDLQNKRQWRLDRIEWALAYNKTRYDPIKQQAYHRKWYETNAEHAKEKVKKWKRENPEQVLTNHHRRRARERGATGEHRTEDIEDIFKQQRGKCAYCRARLTADNTHRDHIVALSKGGTNDRKNIQLLCSTCNVRKHDSDPISYARKLGRLI